MNDPLEDDPLWLAAEFHKMFPEADTSDQTDEELGLEIIEMRDEILRNEERKKHANS